MQARRVWMALGGVAVVLVAVLAVSWTRLQAVSPAGDVDRTGGTIPVSEDQQVLATVGVQPGEVGPGLTVSLMDGGDQLSQPTLDLCNLHFASEAHRQARRQVDVQDSSGDVVLSTEAVLYQDQAGAAEAMAEVRGAPSRCRLVNGVEVDHQLDVPTLSGVDRVAMVDDQVEAVYLRRGRLLVGIYSAADLGTVVPGASPTLDAAVERVQERVADLPADQVR